MTKILSVVSLIVLLIVVVLTVSFAWNQDTKIMKSLVVNNKLEKYGVTIITSTNSDFDTELTTCLKDSKESVAPYTDAMKPFAVFVKNMSNKDIVGISLRWEIIKPDGSIQVSPQTEMSPNQLMGIKPRNPLLRGSLIPSNSSRFFALDNNIQSLVRNESDRKIWNRPSVLTGEKIKQLQNYVPELRAKKQKMAKESISISVAIDGIFFGDGTFVGTDQDYLFATIKAYVQAQKDFVKEVREAVKAKKSPKEIFKWFEFLAAERPPAPDRLNSNEAENYEYSYKVEFYYSAETSLRKKQKWTESEIIEKITATEFDDSILLRKEDL